MQNMYTAFIILILWILILVTMQTIEEIQTLLENKDRYIINQKLI